MTTTMLASWAVTSWVVALAGPFGTFSTQPFSWRLLYWGGVIAVAIIIAISLRSLWRTVLVGRPSWQEDFAVAGSLSLVFGPLVVAVNRTLGDEEAAQAMGMPLASVIVFGIACVIIAVRRTIEASAVTEAAPVKQARDRLLLRVPEAGDARLARIASDNHHIRIVTHDGQEHRLLMRLRDAVQEIDVEPGFCVHRSHWVAKSAIVKVVPNGTREAVQLICGSQVPVGPKYRSNLIDAGVISD